MLLTLQKFHMYDYNLLNDVLTHSYPYNAQLQPQTVLYISYKVRTVSSPIVSRQESVNLCSAFNCCS
jgi:hypothetical protein